MQETQDRLLTLVDRVVGKLGLTSFLNGLMIRIIPQAIVYAHDCPVYCNYTNCMAVPCSPPQWRAIALCANPGWTACWWESYFVDMGCACY